uniref:Uncharacterized protein n=1 Tax=Romanomermis culicivorax TaxID=13658 RepID=A0A915I2X3_ROMCU
MKQNRGNVKKCYFRARMFPEFQEAKQVFPCLNKLEQETTQKKCDPKCQIYKQALQKWETLGMTPEVVTDNFDELAEQRTRSRSSPQPPLAKQQINN